MVQINFAKREVQCKIVYYGPARVGKTTNLRSIHERSPAAVHGNLTSIATDTERTLFFDFLPLNLGQLAGIRTKIHLYAVPYLERRNSVRLLVLEGADGIVFVASRARSMLDENRLALENLRENLTALERTFEEIPMVFQWNFGDAPDAVSAAVLQSQLNPAGAPAFEATATGGTGVFTTLKTITQLVLKHAAPVRAVKEAEESANPVGALLKGGDSVKPQEREKELPAAAAAEAEPLEPVRMPSWHCRVPPNPVGDHAETTFSPPQEQEQPETAPAGEAAAAFEEETDTRTGAIRSAPKPHDDFEFHPAPVKEPAEPEPVSAAADEQEQANVGLRFELEAMAAEEGAPPAGPVAGEVPPTEPAGEQPVFSAEQEIEAEDPGPSHHEEDEPASRGPARREPEPAPEPEPAGMGSRYVTVGPPSRRRRISQPRTHDGWHTQERISRPARDARVVVDRRRHPRSPEERFVPLRTVLLGAFAGAMSLSVVGYLVYVLL